MIVRSVTKVVPESADYACIRCSEIVHMKAGKNNYVRAVQIQNGRRQVGQTGDLTVKTSAFANNPRDSLCDANNILPSTVLLIAMCSLNDKTDSHRNNVLPVVAID